MTQSREIILVGVGSEFPDDVVDDINGLMHQLDQTFTAETARSAADLTQAFAQSTERDVFLASYARVRKVIGTVTVNRVLEPNRRGDTVAVGAVAVDEDARGKGVGTAVMVGPVQWALDKGMPNASLNTEDHRPDARALYEKIGYKEVDGTRGHYVREVPERTITSLVPRDVVPSFFGNTLTLTGQLSGGLVNRTFLAQTWGQERDDVAWSILQEINPVVFDERMVADNAAVSERLAEAGWDVPQTLRTAEGALWFRDEAGSLWRRLSYIQSDGTTPEILTTEALHSIGDLLGRLHGTLVKLDYEPTFSIPHFHETQFHAERLQVLQATLPDDETKTFAQTILRAYQKLPKLPNEERQLIHGDFQPTNLLFQDGMPKNVIDFDALMLGSIWMDLGDLLRATLEDDLKAGRPLALEKLRPIVEGYRRAARPETDADEFYTAAITATQLIALELAMRFTNDIVDDNYFNWDASYGNRRSNHMHRAGWQWQIYEALNDPGRH